MAFNTHPNGYWITNDKNFFQVDEFILNSIFNFLNKKQYLTVFDFGCGSGELCEFLNKEGIQTIGVDGNPYLKSFQKKTIIADLSKSIKFAEKKDCILALNVGQYIPKEFESNFIDNICNHCLGSVILKWPEFKDNSLEVNCNSKEYLIQQMTIRGFKFDSSNTYDLQQRSFNQNILVFEKKKPIDKSVRSVEK